MVTQFLFRLALPMVLQLAEVARPWLALEREVTREDRHLLSGWGSLGEELAYRTREGVVVPLMVVRAVRDSSGESHLYLELVQLAGQVVVECSLVLELEGQANL